MGIERRGLAGRLGLCFPALWFVGSTRTFSSDTSSSADTTKSKCNDEDDNGNGKVVGEGEAISFAEAKRLMRLVNVDALKSKLGAEGKEAINYCELLQACESVGLARSPAEAAAFARVLDEAGVVLLFRDKVYLHPDKVKIFSTLFFLLLLFLNSQWLFSWFYTYFRHRLGTICISFPCFP